MGCEDRDSVRNRLKPPVRQEMRSGRSSKQAWQRWVPPASLRGGGGLRASGVPDLNKQQQSGPREVRAEVCRATSRASSASS